MDHDAHLLLLSDHTLQEGLERRLEVINALLLEARDLVLNETRDVIELLFRIECTTLCFCDECERAAESIRAELTLRAIALVRLLGALKVCVGVLPCMIDAHARAESKLKWNDE